MEGTRFFLEIIKADITASEGLLRMSNEDAMLGLSAYHLSQAFEKLLKYDLNQNGIKYPRTHRIQDLLVIFKDNNLTYPEELDILQYELSDWAVSTRYNINRFLRVNKLEEVLGVAKRYFEEVRSNEVTTAEGTLNSTIETLEWQ